MNLTNIYLGNVLYTRDVHLPEATVLEGNDGYTFFIRMTETQRANALRISSVPGGDGDAVVLQADPAAVRDVAGNFNPFVTNGINANEIADTSKPFAVSAEIFYGTGTLIIKVNETLDLTTASTNVKRERFYLSASSGSHDKSLAGADVGEGDGLYMTIHLTEAQRVFGLLTSATTGGDSSIVFCFSLLT